MGTYDGMAVPLFGGYTAYASDGTTAFLTVNATGTHDFTWTNPGADNYISVTVADATTVTTGYFQPFYANLTCTGSKSTGNTQITAFATDITLGGTISCEAQGMYVYISGSGTLTGANVSGIVVNIADLGGQCSTRAGIQIHWSDNDVASSQDAFILCRFDDANAAARAVIDMNSTGMTNPEFFLVTNAVASTEHMYCPQAIDSMTGVGSLRIKVGSTILRIPLVADSCS